MYRGPNAAEHFLTCLIEEEEAILDLLKVVRPISMTPEDCQRFDSAVDCHICEKPLNGDKVRNTLQNLEFSNV